MGDVVECQPRDGESPERLFAGDFAQAGQGVVARPEFQGDEGIEAARLVLQFAQGEQVVDAVFPAFEVAEKHRAVGGNAHPVGGAVDLEPAFARAFVGADLPADVRCEDFRAAARHRIEPRFAQRLQAGLGREAVVAPHIVDFNGRVGLDGDGFFGGFVRTGEALGHGDDLPVVVEGLAGMHAAHDVDFGHTGLELGFAIGENVIQRHAPGAGLRRVVAAVGAETAAVGADVGRLDVEVPVVPDAVAVQALAHKRRRRLQFGQGRLIKIRQRFPGKSYQRSSELTVSFLRP